MADPWPAALPTLRLPATIGMRDNVLRTPADVGPGESRRRSTATFLPFSHVLRLTPAQLTTFKTFWEGTIADGTLPFELALGDPVNATVDIRFAAAPSFSKNGHHWVATVQLEILP